MKAKNLIFCVLVGLTVCLGIRWSALSQQTWTWNGGDGNWDTYNWTPGGHIPGNQINEIEVIPDGEVVLDTTGAGLTKFSAGLEIGSDASLLAYKSIKFNWPTEPRNVAVANQGSIQLLATSEVIALNAADTIVTMTGAGRLIMGGSGQHQITNGGWGGSFINESGHTIQGRGYIYTNFINRGRITATLGTLEFGGGYNPLMTNTNGILEASGTGSVFFLHGGQGVDGGQILPNDGEVHIGGTTLRNTSLGSGTVRIVNNSTFGNNVNLSNGTALTLAGGYALSFSNGPGGTTTLTNNGTVTLANASGTWLDMRDNNVILNGFGQVVLGGHLSSGISNGGWGGTCTNGINHTVRGGGSIACPFINLGNLIVDNGVLRLFSNFTGTGPVSVADTGTLEITATAQFGDFSMSREAGWIVWWGGKVVEIQGDFSFAQQNTGKWIFQDDQVTLKMSGGGETYLEVGGQDYGLSELGFSSNFNLPKLVVSGSGTFTRLLDAIDNGHRSSAEALYVTQLQVDPGATLHLNGLRLYTKRAGIIYRVQAGEGGLYGGGQILDNPKVFLPLINR